MPNQNHRIPRVKEVDGKYQLPRLLTKQQIIGLALKLQYRDVKSKPVMNSPEEVKQYFQLRLAGHQNEVFSVLFLSSKHYVIDCLDLHEGTIDHCSVYARNILVEALRLNAAAVIIAHNHPSGITDPSRADRMLTATLGSALATISVNLLDHIIVGDGESLSLAESGQMPVIST